MSVNTATLSGADWKRFYKDPAVWGEDTYWEDGVVSVNGDSEAPLGDDNINDSDVVVVKDGFIVDGLPGVPDGLVDAALWWQKRQSHRTLIVTIPSEKLEKAVTALRALGIEVDAP